MIIRSDECSAWLVVHLHATKSEEYKINILLFNTTA
jgi:hypothetical protein